MNSFREAIILTLIMLLLLKLCDEHEFTSLQIEIDAALERDLKKNRKRKLGLPGTIDEYDESTETDKFIGESTISVINECLTVDADGQPKKNETIVKAEAKPVVVAPVALGLKPDLLALCTVSEKEHAFLSLSKNPTEVIDDLNLDDLDDEEIDGYILTESEAVLKDRLWNKMNAEYLKIAKEREERAAREREEGKPEKKKRRSRKKPIGPSSTALDAIQKVLQEKKISSKINYDILKSLTEPATDDVVKPEDETVDVKPVFIDESHLSRPSTSRKSQFNLSNNRRSKVPQMGFPMASATDDEAKNQTVVETGELHQIQDFKTIRFNENFLDDVADTDIEEAMDPDDPPEPQQEESDRLGDILNQGDDDEYSGPEEYF